MKFLTTICLFFILNTSSFSQILNSDFENWETMDTCQVLSDWQIVSPSKSFTQSPVSFSGDWALKVNSEINYDNYELCGATWISQKLDLSSYDSPILLEFNSISKSLTNDSLSYIGSYIFYYDDNTLHQSSFLDTSSTYKKRELTLYPELSDSILITFRLGAATGPADGCYYHSEICLDNIILNPVVNSKIEAIRQYSLAPNPFMHEFKCENCPANSRYSIFDLNGAIIDTGSMNQNIIHFNKKGVFFFKLENSNEIYKIVSL